LISKRHGVSYNQIRWSWRIFIIVIHYKQFLLLVTSLCDYILTLVCLVVLKASFKIKYKQLDKRGNQVLKLILK
jgi:hypothetical protein